MSTRKQPKKSFFQRYMPIIFLVALGGSALYTFNVLRPALISGSVPQAAVTHSLKIGGKTLINEETSKEEYLAVVKELDRQLLDKLKDIKAERRKRVNDPLAPVRHYDERLGELEKSYAKFKQGADRKNSIGYDLKQQIIKMKGDPPPLN